MSSLTTDLIVHSFIRFLREKMSTNDASSDFSLSIDVAIQCLEQAFQPRALTTEQRPPHTLEDIYLKGLEGLGFTPVERTTEATPDEKSHAEELKNMGNELLKNDKVREGLDCYNKAIELDPSNAVYYCNRAAAHSRLGNHTDAIKDCKKAVQIDPTYSKAYGRLGVAYTSLRQHEKARDAYKKALELDPENDSYKNNLAMSEQKLFMEQMSNSGSNQNDPNLGNLGNFSRFLTNPQLVSMATEMLSDPNMQNLISGIMGAYGNNDFSSILQAGQQLAQQMNQQNPNFVNDLRNNMQNQQQAANNQQQQPQQQEQPSDEPPVRPGDAPPSINKNDEDDY